VARNLLCACWIAVAAIISLASRAPAAVPSEQLLPETTVAYLAAPDVDAVRAKWNEIQLGQLFDDPVMKPFVEDLNKQLQSKLSKTGIKLGITWEDLDGVYGGEVCLAAVQPEHKQTLHGLVLLVDVTGKKPEVDALLKKVVASQTAKGSKIAAKKIGGQTVTEFTIKRREGVLPDHAYYAVVNNYLVATDHEGTLALILAELQKPGGKTLAGVKAFQVSSATAAKDAGELKPHLRWYVNPFAYAEVARAMAGGKKKRGTDILKVLRNQGFGAIQGASGYITLGTGEHEILHRSFIYAPADPKAVSGERYRLAARMLEFPNKAIQPPPAWIPANAAAFASLNWKMRDALGKYLGTIVDEFAGGEVFEEVLESIKNDPAGPKVDLRKGLIDLLGERAFLVTDCIEPIDTRSERLMVAVEIVDPKTVAETIERAMKVDPDARRRDYNGHVIWEITNEGKTEFVDEIKIDGPGTIPDEVAAAPGDAAPAGGDGPKIPNSAVTVVHGHLIVASHVDFIIKAIDEQPATLDAGEDYQRVQHALTALGAGDVALRHFVRTDKAYHATYELVKQGKMPQAETVLGRVLNHLAADEDEDESVVREQQIDGSKMPDYEAVRKYLGPAGFFMQSQDEGWTVTGCLLKK
jgi:hypothetical protein